MPIQKLAGKASYFTYNGVTIAIRKVTPKVDKGMANSTASNNYDAATDLVHKEQIPNDIQTTLDVEGPWDKNSTDAQLVSKLYSGAAAVPVVLGLDSGTIFGHGNFDISNFQLVMDILTDEVVGWTATFLSNGVFTHGS